MSGGVTETTPAGRLGTPALRYLYDLEDKSLVTREVLLSVIHIPSFLKGSLVAFHLSKTIGEHVNTFLFVWRGLRTIVPHSVEVTLQLSLLSDGSLIYGWFWCRVVVSVVLQRVVSEEGSLCLPITLPDRTFVLSDGVQVIQEVKVEEKINAYNCHFN